MTYEEFKTTFPVGSSLRVFERRPRHVVGYHDSEKVAVLKWWSNQNDGWEYEILTSDEMMVWKDYLKKV